MKLVFVCLILCHLKHGIDARQQQCLKLNEAQEMNDQISKFFIFVGASTGHDCVLFSQGKHTM